MVGAMSGPGLSVAARHAEVVGFAGLRQITGAPGGTFTLSSAAETAQRVDQVRAGADGRPYRSDVLLQRVVIGRDPEAAAAEIAASGSTSPLSSSWTLRSCSSPETPAKPRQSCGCRTR